MPIPRRAFFFLPKSLKTGHWFASAHRVINAGLPTLLEAEVGYQALAPPLWAFG